MGSAASWFLQNGINIPRGLMTGPSPQPSSSSQKSSPAASEELHPHDFDAQKQLHQKIRNDPDYDDWEYGTEPLPHEAWVAKQASAREQPPASANS